MAKITGSQVCFAFLCGVFFVFNVPIVSFGDKAVRALDLIGLVSALHCVRLLFSASKGHVFWAIFVCATAFSLCVMLSAVLDDDFERGMLLARMVLSVCAGVALVVFCVSGDMKRALFLGMWFGALLGLGVAVGQFLGSDFFMSFIPPDADRSDIFGVWRPSGIWGHPNAQAQITLAGAAAALLAWKRSDKRILLQLFLYFSIAALNYFVSENRAPLVVGGLVSFIVLLRNENLFVRIPSLFALLSGSCLLLLAPELVLSDRWTGSFSGMSTADQAGERFRSNASGLWIALNAPLGLPISDQKDRLFEMAGVRASHNGYIHLALSVGPFLAACAFGVFICGYLRAKVTRQEYFLSFSLASVLGMLFFEDSTTDPSMVAILSVFAAFMLGKASLTTGPINFKNG